MVDIKCPKCGHQIDPFFDLNDKRVIIQGGIVVSEED